jgi:hypothetical protein
VYAASEARPASYLIGTAVHFAGDEAKVTKMIIDMRLGIELINNGTMPPFPHTLSWSGVYIGTELTLLSQTDTVI